MPGAPNSYWKASGHGGLQSQKVAMETHRGSMNACTIVHCSMVASKLKKTADN